MNTLEFLNQLTASGIVVIAEDGQLQVDAPVGTLTPELRFELSSRKPEILDLLLEASDAAGQTLPPIQAIERSDPLMLSFSQERVFLANQLNPDHPVQHIPLAWQICGQVDKYQLRHSLSALIQRQEVLRTGFIERDGRPNPCVQSAESLSLLPSKDESLEWFDQVDLTAYAEAEREPVLEAKMLQLIERPFDLARPPLLRAAWFKTEANLGVLLLVFHQIVIDGEAGDLLLDELIAHYGAADERSLPELDVQYLDFAHWQRGWLHGAVSDRQQSFWTEQYQSPYRPLDLPTDRPRPTVEKALSGFQSLQIPDALLADLKVMTQRNGSTLYHVLLAALTLVLSPYSGDDEVMIFTSSAGRDQQVLKPLLGLFANLLPIRSGLAEQQGFNDYLVELGSTVRAALANQALPLDRKLGALEFTGAGDHAALFQIMFTAGQAGRTVQTADGLEFSPRPVHNPRVSFDLHFHLLEGPAETQVHLDYKTERFDSSTAAALLTQLISVLEQVVSDPKLPLKSLAPERLKSATVSNGTVPAQTGSASITAPRTDLERQVVRIWEKVFNRKPIGIHENFFDLGGNSLMASRMLALIEQALLGEALSLTTLPQAPTVAELAERLQSERKADLAALSHLPSLVPIKPQGSKTPFFCADATSGMLLNLFTLARYLDADQPLYALRVQNWLEGVHPMRAQEFASRYVKEIRQIQPEGPYLLGGTCFGGSVAMEMARQLGDQDQSVTLVALFDEYTPDGFYRLPRKRSLLGRQIDRLNDHLAGFRNTARGDRPMYVWRAVRAAGSLAKWFITTKIRQGWQKIRSTSWRFVHALFSRLGRPLPTSLQNVQEARTLAAVTYEPRSYHGHVVGFRASERLEEYIHYDPEMGWGRWIDGRLDIVEVPGDHSSMWQQPHIVTLAQHLNSSLAGVQREQP